MNRLKTLSISSWQNPLSFDLQIETIQALENGQVIFLPQLAFHILPEEQSILTPDYSTMKSKNISFNQSTNELRGINKGIIPQEKYHLIHNLLARFANQATHFIKMMFPHYMNALTIGRTSFRPVEIKGRVSSYRKDDTRLHVDAFPSSPNHGCRILRVFSNVNPHKQPRVWRLGEPFEKVAKQFLPALKKPLPASALLLQTLKITKRRRTLYDHFMLQLHNHMKANQSYQKNADQQEVHFPSNTTWIVQTDHVSHAVMSGQFLLEQTFYLPVQAMMDSGKSPLRVLEKLMQKNLV